MGEIHEGKFMYGLAARYSIEAIFYYSDKAWGGVFTLLTCLFINKCLD